MIEDSEDDARCALRSVESGVGEWEPAGVGAAAAGGIGERKYTAKFAFVRVCPHIF
jgi:hypothetical protein